MSDTVNHCNVCGREVDYTLNMPCDDCWEWWQRIRHEVLVPRLARFDREYRDRVMAGSIKWRHYPQIIT